MSAFVSTLYVLKDKDSSTQGRVAAGLQLAARAALSPGAEAPLGSALQLLMQAKMLRPCHKVALISGFAAALSHLYPDLMNSQPERLLEATPQACSWLAGQAPANKYIEISLGGYSSPDAVRLNPPCLIPGHASVGVFNENSALAWARALTGRDVARSELVVSDVCHAMRRLAARTPELESNDLGARTYSPIVGTSREATRPPRIDDVNALERPSRSEGYGSPAFSRLPLLDAVRHQHSSCMIFMQSLLVVCENHGKKGGEETFERNVFFPLTGESKSLNLKLCASDEARAHGTASAVETNRAHNARLAAARPREHRVESRTSPKHDWRRPQRLEAPVDLPRARYGDDADVSGGAEVREIVSESAAAAEHRGFFEQATFVALDISSSMLEKLTRHERDGPEVERGSTRTLFVAWKPGAPRSPQDIIAGIHEACKANGAPVPSDVRVHKHREGNRCKNSAHVTFRNAEAAEAAIEALGKVRLWGGKLRVDRAADGRPPAPRGGARAEDPGSRMAHAKLALQCLADRIETLDLPHATGLMLFGSDVTVPCALTPLLELFSTATSKAREARADARGGTTRLVAALHQAAQRLADFGARHVCKLSVLLISDGDDTSRDSAFDALRLLRDADVVVDLVVLGGARAGEAAALAEATGGTVYHPQSDSELVAIFEDEATLRLARRAPREPPMPTPKQFQRAAQRLNAALREAHRAGPAVHDSLAAGGLLAPAVSNGAVAGTAAVSSALRQLARPSAPPDDAVIVNGFIGMPKEAMNPMRIQRLMKEARRVIEPPHEQLTVFVGDRLDVWQAVLTGPEDDETCPYAGAAFRLLIQFPDDYPSRPPEIHVATPILHVNVSAQGRVCHSVLDREYSPSFGMDHLLCCVASLLIAPDTNDPFKRPWRFSTTRTRAPTTRRSATPSSSTRAGPRMTSPTTSWKGFVIISESLYPILTCVCDYLL